jgi:hypothetical protein
MEIIYNWVILNLDTAPSDDGLTDVVKVIHWSREGRTIVDAKEYVADTFSSYNCSSPNPTDFTAYLDLTKEQIISWLEAGIDVEKQDAIIAQKLENQINPPIVNLPLPWTEKTTTTTTTTEIPPHPSEL